MEYNIYWDDLNKAAQEAMQDAGFVWSEKYDHQWIGTIDLPDPDSKESWYDLADSMGCESPSDFDYEE